LSPGKGKAAPAALSRPARLWDVLLWLFELSKDGDGAPPPGLKEVYADQNQAAGLRGRVQGAARRRAGAAQRAGAEARRADRGGAAAAAGEEGRARCRWERSSLSCEVRAAHAAE